MNDSKIYGIFGDGSSSEDDSSKNKKKPTPSFVQSSGVGLNKGYMNFVKSDKILYQPEAGKVRVSFGKKQDTAAEKPSEEKDQKEKLKGMDTKKSVRINEENNEEMVFDKKKPISKLTDFISSEEEAQEDEEDLIAARINKEVLKRKNKFNLKKFSAPKEADDFGLPTILGKRRRPIFEESKPVSNPQDKEEAEMQGLYGKGLKMMQALGYKLGTGLGAQEQGRIDPIQAYKKTVLDGKNLPSTKNVKVSQESSMKDDLLNDLEEENLAVEEEGILKLWKKDRKRGKMNFLRKTGHVRAADISVPENEIIKPTIQQKVIDMRGPKAVYFEDYSAIKTLEQGKRPAALITKIGFLNEMLLTLRGKIDKTKYNIQSSDRKIKIEKDKIVNMKYEKEQLEEDQQKLNKNIEGLKILQTKLKQFQTQSGSLDTKEILQLFEDCFNAIPEHFVSLNLDHLFVDTVSKKLQAEVQNLQITENTLDSNYSLYSQIRNFLKKTLQFHDYLKFNMYADKNAGFTFSTDYSFDEQKLEKYLIKLFSQTWMLPIRFFILNQWKPEDPEILISLLEKWKSLIPDVILAEVYDTIIIPKLQQFVDAWSPTTDKMPIHIRLHPWFPLLGTNRLGKLWKSIQFKISQLLTDWEPQDKSALVLLKPWFRVFERGLWENLVDRCILPKLLYALKDFEINPKKQKIESLKWLLEWADYIPQDNLIGILEKHVLRKIVEVGMNWISSPNFKLEEVKMWIAGWKELLGENVMSLPAVKHHFQSFENIL